MLFDNLGGRRSSHGATSRAAERHRPAGWSRRAGTALPVQRADHGQLLRIDDVRVNHRCIDVGMSKKSLDPANITAALEKMRGEAVPERMD